MTPSSPRVFVAFVEEVMLKKALEQYPKYVKEIFSHDSDFDEVKEVLREKLTDSFKERIQPR